MEFNQNDLSALIRDVSETKRNTIIVLFSSTLLLFWWLGDLVFPLYLDRDYGINYILAMTVTITPIIINMVAWGVWGLLGQRLGVFYSHDSHIRHRDPYERYELSIAELFKHKKIERVVYLLSAAQFVIMGFMLIFGFLFIIR